MTRRELVDELDSLANKIKDNTDVTSVAITSILYSMCASILIEDEVSLSLLVNEYNKVTSTVIKSRINARNAHNN